ncbi:MAG: helix-turn-helix transcriptional regulator [Nitrosomonadaceae bacterium]
MNIGVAIRVALAKRNKSQTWLANEVDVTRPFLSNLCNNNKAPSIGMLRKIACALGMPVSELIKGGEGD